MRRMHEPRAVAIAITAKQDSAFWPMAFFFLATALVLFR